jgi:hypothetical protein
MSDIDRIKTEVIDLMQETRKWHSQREYKNLSREEFIEKMKVKFEFLYCKSSTLFNNAIAGDLNMNQLNYMLLMLKKVNEGGDYHKVSTEVGQNLVDVYVKPLLDKDKK